MEEEELVQVIDKFILHDNSTIPQPLFMFVEGSDRVNLREERGIQRAFSASATCLDRSLEVGGFAFFSNSLSEMPR